jgi:hypothetical protein
MKTLNPGLTRTERPWWAGQVVFCPHCRYSGELKTVVEDGINGKRAVTIPCPNCGGEARWDNGY